MKRKVNWKRVILISVIAVAILIGIWSPKENLFISIGERFIDWGISDEYLSDSFYINADDLNYGDLYVCRVQVPIQRISMGRDWYYWSPTTGTWWDSREGIGVLPDSSLYQKLEEIRQYIRIPEAEGD